jgi:flagellar hook-associated protein 1 FlgK
VGTFSGISTALSSLQAQRVAMDVAGQNIANVSTPGYSRQRVEMTAGIGVDVSSIQRLHSGILGDRARTESARLGDLNVTSAVLTQIEQVFPEPSTSGFQSKLDALWSGFSNVSRDPNNAAARIQVIAQANVLTGWLNDAAEQLTTISTSQSQNLSNLVTSANSYAQQISELNIAIGLTPEGTSAINALMDQRSFAASQLAEAVGGTYLIDSANKMSVSLGGAAFVGPSNYATLQVATTAGTTSVQWSSNDSTAVVSSGNASGYLTAINTTIPDWRADLDSVAAALASKVNTAQAAGFDSAGTAGTDLFTGTTAATISVALTDGSKIAASSVAPVGGVASLNGSNADAMAALGRSAGGPDELYQNLVVSLGYATQGAAQTAQTVQAFMAGITGQINSESGVNIDEEMANLLTYQRAYEAAARVLTSIDEALDTLINRTGLVGR